MWRCVRVPALSFAVTVAVSAFGVVASPPSAQAQNYSWLADASKVEGGLLPAQRKLVSNARDLTYDLWEDAPCFRGEAHRQIIQESLDALRQLSTLRDGAADPATRDYFNRIRRNLSEALDFYEEECGPPFRLRVGEYLVRPVVPEIELSGGATQIQMPGQAYLGLNNGVSDQLGLYTTPRYATGSSFSGSMKFNTSGLISPVYQFDNTRTATWMKLTGFYTHVQLDDTPGTISPGNGNRTLFPGPQGAASGVSVGGFPANIVTGARYTSDFNKFGIRLDLGQTSHFPMGIDVNLYGSIAGGHSSYSQVFSGAVPGLNRVFAYNTDIDVNFLNLYAGFGLRKSFPMISGCIFWFGGYVEVGPNFLWGSGTDRFSFTGVQSSSADLSEKETTLGYSARLTAGFETPRRDLSLSLSVGYALETGLPLVTRDGTNPSRLSLDDGDRYDVRFLLTKRFGYTPPVLLPY